MVPCDEHAWINILKLVEETGADGVELNFGCPHGMSERGMGSAVGQVPEYVEMVARWCKTHTRMPVLVKLTPNVTSIMGPARAAKAGGADGVSLINTINSITSIDLDAMARQQSGVAFGVLPAWGLSQRLPQVVAGFGFVPKEVRNGTQGPHQPEPLSLLYVRIGKINPVKGQHRRQRRVATKGRWNRHVQLGRIKVGEFMDAQRCLM
jgi:hypothetical protein